MQHGLRRQLGLGDLVLAQVLCVVGSSWVGVAAGLGRAQMLFWLGAMVAFYLPMAASVIGLNREMPLEGGLYVWAHRAFGNLAGFLTAWNILIYAVAVTAAILYAVPSEISYLIGPSAAWLPENRLISLAIVSATVAGVTVGSILGLDVGKWVQNIGGIAILAVFSVLILLPLWGLARHQPIHWSPISFTAPAPDLRTMALFGQIMFGGLCGLEYVAILAGESRQPVRTIGRSVWIASPIICAMFILGTSTVVAYVPQRSIDFIAPIPQVMRSPLGQTGLANVIAMTAIFLIEVRLLGAASMIFTGATRLPMTAGWDELVPRWFAHLHPRWRTPVNSIVCMALLVFLLLVLANCRRARTGGLSIAVQRQHHALRDRLSGDVRRASGGTRGPAQAIAYVAQTDLDCRREFDAIQPAHFSLPVRQRGKRARLRHQDRRYSAGE